MGWTPTDFDFDGLKENKVVMVFPHSSINDGLLASLYAMCDEKLVRSRELLTVIVREKKSILDYFIHNISPIKIINLKKKDEKIQGNLDAIIDKLKDQEKWFLLISPSGAYTSEKPWRKGWYHIAKTFGAPILVCGPDYNLHKMTAVKELVHIGDRSYEEVEKEIKSKMNAIVPLKLNCEHGVGTRNHEERSFIPRKNVYSWIFVLFLLFLVLIIALWNTRENKYVKYNRKNYHMSHRTDNNETFPLI
jgi:hypothetical protein